VEYTQGTTGLNLGGQAVDLYTSHPLVLATDDEVVIESGPPAGKREYHTVAGHNTTAAGTLITIGGDGSNLFDDYPAGSVVRYSDLYPALILGPGQVGGALLTHDHRITYTLDLLLSSIQPLPDPTVQGGAGDGDEPDWAN
jgi:hypothetical protein